MKTSLPLNLSSLIASFFLTTSAFAQTIWTAGVGNWFTPGNWSAGVPNPASGTSFDAQINNGGIAQIFSPGASVRRITLGASNGQGGGLQINAGTLNVTENLHLGEGGNGVATISNGSTVTSNYTRIGRFNGSSGSATVFGEGSTWRTTLDFLVGESGSGALVADAGGDVVVGNNLLVANVLGAPQSSVTVRGAGSTITVNGSVLRVGAAGNGILKIETNGAVSAATVEIGNSSGSVGTLNLETGGTLTVGGGAQPLVLAKLAGSSGTLNIGNVGAAGVLIASAVQVGSGTGVVNFHSSGTTAFAVPITGAASVNKLGAGTTTLTAVNTFTRAVTVSGGVLELANGGQINNAFDSNVTEGLVRITGAGSKWANTATTIIGDSATGAISVESGGELRANAALLVSRVGSGNGTLTVTGAGSTATTNGELRIADQGAGLLEILDGGVVTSGHGYLAQNTVLASATAHISGPNSRWSITGFLDVGNRGAGTLNIENAGAVVNTAGGYVGFIGGSNGAAIVDGAGSVWDSNFFQVGGSGVGSLTIRNGGTAISRLAGTNSVSLGEATSGNGTVTVNGAGSTWTNLGSIVIGTNGRGTMNVQAGGYASAGPNASIGYNSGAIGTATVTGAGSQFNVPGMLTVGGRSDSTTTAGGSGTLTVADGGLVTVGGTGAPSATSGVMRIGWQTGSTGVVNVTGPGSTLTSDYFVVIGSAGNGTMTISNGGYVLTDSTGIGNSAGSTGLLTVTGAGSRYDDTYGIYLGLVGNGVGTLAISDGGLVNVVGGTGTVTVGSASSTGASTLRIGTGAGAGTLAAGGVSLVRTFSKLEFNHTDNTTFSVPITGAGFVNKLGFGTTTLNIPNSYTGGTTINGGTVRVIETTGAGLGTGAVTVNTFGRLNFGDQGLGGSNTVNVFASPTSNGYGGVLSFTETASAGALRVFQYGTTFPSVYTESETYFDDSSTAGAATFTNFGGQAGGNAHGGAVFFLGNGSAGNATFTNNGAAVAGAGGGFVTIQRDARGGTARFINNGTSTLDSRGLGNGGSVGITERANAENATFTNNGGTASGGSSGGVAVSREASAGSATFTNMPGTVSGAPGGRVSFYDTATAESATIANLGATVNGANAGVTRFQDMATAGASTIRNARSVAASGAGGTTVFANTALAGTATITNEGSQNGTYGFTEFRDTSNAASATFFNGASLTAGTFGGRPIFLNSSSAGSAIFDNEGSKVTNGFAGEVFFQDTSNAATSIITNRGATAADAFSGGIAYFLNSATGGAVNIVNEGSNFTNGTNTSGGSARFNDTTSAGNATILNGSATSVSGNPGGTFFYGSSTAGSAAINNSGGTVNPGGWTALSAGGAASFTATSSAGSATITNAAAPAMNSSGGHTSFVGTSTAGTATINNQGGVVLSNGWGAVAGGGSGYVTFGETATAGSATIDNQGAAVAGGGRGTTTFSGNSNAGNATIYIDAGIGAGGEVQFSGTSDGGTARVILAGTGVDAGGLDISLLTSGGMGLGSIEGEGVVSLGAKYLTVGKNNLDTTFGGLIRDGGYSGATGGGLNKVGTGTLTLTSPNTYTGATSISAGTLRVSETTGQALSNSWTTVGPGSTLEYTGNGRGGGNTVINFPSSTANGYGGKISFRDTASAGTLNVSQGGTTFSSVYTEAATYFDDFSTAGDATFTNAGGQTGGNAHGGAVFFLGFSSAGNATFTNEGGAVAGAASGFVTMQRDSRGGTAHFINKGTSTVDSRGLQNGGTVFIGERANAENATFTNNGSTASGGSSGGVSVFDTASAGSATFANLPGTVSGAPGGRTSFRSTATAANAQIENRDAPVAGALAGYTQFFDSATAGAATITSFGASGPNLNPGELKFFNQSNAGTATVIAKGGGMHNMFAASTPGGLVTFNDTSNTGTATFTLEAGTAGGGAGGAVKFRNNSSAASGSFTALAPTINAGTSGGLVEFYDTSTAGSAAFTMEGAKNFNAYFGATGSVIFYNQSTASTATLTNLPATATSANGGFTGFSNTATAGSATFINRGGGIASGQGGDIGFFSSSTAGNSTINVLGGEVAGAQGSSLRFNDTSTAGRATILTLGSPVGGSGGYTRFYNNSSGGNAAFITQGNGLFDIRFLASSGTTAGSIAGSGNYSLGAKSLTVGSLNTDTTISGSIYGAGGTLTKVGTGTLTIDALQDYATLNVNDGTVIVGTSLGTGPSVINVLASAEVRASQTLAALTIGAGAIVTLSSAVPAAPADSGGDLTAKIGSLALNDGSQHPRDGAEMLDGFDVFDAGNIAGSFEEVNLPALPGDLTWDDSQLSSTGTLRVVPEPGVGVLLASALALLGLRRRGHATSSKY